MSIKSQLKNDTVTLFLDGSFDVSQYEEFKQICKKYDEPQNHFIVDFEKTVYMDSSALGMLLLLREQTQGDRSRVSLINTGETVMKILKIAHFNQLFEIKKID